MKSLIKLLTAMTVIGTLTTLRADTTPPAAPPPPPAKPLSAANITASVNVLTTQMKDDYQHALHLQAVAKKQRDVIKLNCVNDTLVQLKSQQNIADDDGRQLQASLAANRDDTQTLYVAFTATASEIKKLRNDADACVGEVELSKQDGTQGPESHHPMIPDDPTTINPNAVDVEAPGYTSPFN